MANMPSKKEQARARVIAMRDKAKNDKAFLARYPKRPTASTYKTQRAKRDRKAFIGKGDLASLPGALTGLLTNVGKGVSLRSGLAKAQARWDKANKAVKALESTKPKSTAKPPPKVTELPDQGRIGTVQEETRRAAAPKPRVPDDPKTRSALESFVSRSGDVPAKAKAKAPAKAASLKGAPRPELPKKSDPEYKTKLSKFRKWYTANRSSPKKKAVAQPVAKPAKKAAPKTAAPARTADLTGLQKRIEMKRKSGQAIPAAWLKAEKTAKAKARAAKVAQSSKRIPSSIDRQENQKEAARGRADMAKWKSGVASAKAKRLEAGQRKVADAKAQAEAHNQKARAIKASKSRIAETKAKKADAQARLAKLKANRADQDNRKRRATMSALPGFRSN